MPAPGASLKGVQAYLGRWGLAQPQPTRYTSCSSSRYTVQTGGERRRLRGGGADGDAEKGADQKAAEESSRLGIRRGRTRAGEMEDSTGVER